MITAAADGSSLSNPGPAGWAWYVDDDCWAAGGWPHGTNNMGELMAVLDLLRQTASSPEPLRILCDSQYVINSVTKWMPGWKRKGWRKADGKPVMNVELLQELDRELAGRQVSFEWVKGHNGHRLNEAADLRARAVATAFQQGGPIDHGPGFDGAGTEPAASPMSEPSIVGEAPLFDLEDAGLASERATHDVERRPDALRAEVVAAVRRGRQAADERPEEPVVTPEGLSKGAAEAVRREQLLLQSQTRGARDQVAALLHDDFVEFGQSGRVWTRNRMLATIAPLDVSVRFELIAADDVAPGAVLVTYKAISGRHETLRSSLWLQTDTGWQLRFHQGTRAEHD